MPELQPDVGLRDRVAGASFPNNAYWEAAMRCGLVLAGVVALTAPDSAPSAASPPRSWAIAAEDTSAIASAAITIACFIRGRSMLVGQ